MGEVWNVVRYSEEKLRTTRFMRGGRWVNKEQRLPPVRTVIETHDTEEEACDAARNHPGTVVERERTRADLG